MKDCNGIELQVGDTVCYIGSGGLIKGKVVETVNRSRLNYAGNIVNRDRVVVSRPGYYGRNIRVNLTQPGNVIKVPA